MPEAHRLSELEEARDDLIKIIESDGVCLAIFRFGAVSLPIEMAEQLREMIGHKIAVLRWIDGTYRIKEVKDRHD